VRLNPPTWQATTAYAAVQIGDAALGSIVKSSIYNGRHFKCTTAGTSGGSEPSWSTVVGATTADGSAVWTCIDAWTKEGAVTSMTDSRTFVDLSRTEGSGFLSFGLLTFLTGTNAGWSSEVKTFGYSSTPALQQSSSGVTTAAVGSLTPTYPSTGLAAGDTFWLHVTARNQTTTVTTPSGWTLVTGPDNVATTARSYIFAKIAAGSESGTITVAFGADAAVCKAARIYRFRGGGIVPQSTVLLSGSDATIEAPTLTATTPNALALAFVSEDSNRSVSSWTGETGGDWTEAVSEFLTAAGLAGALQLQTASLSSTTISGGLQTMSGAQGWLVQAFVVLANAEFVLRDAAPNLPQVGDTYEVETGCDKLVATCIAKFNNVYNFRGEPYIPGFHKQFLYPNSQ